MRACEGQEPNARHYRQRLMNEALSTRTPPRPPRRAAVLMIMARRCRLFSRMPAALQVRRRDCTVPPRPPMQHGPPVSLHSLPVGLHRHPLFNALPHHMLTLVEAVVTGSWPPDLIDEPKHKR
jgi:hypothetical protein